jgi:hypothetical protein
VAAIFEIVLDSKFARKRTNERRNEETNIRTKTNEQMNERRNKHTNEQTNEQTNESWVEQHPPVRNEALAREDLTLSRYFSFILN